MAVVSAECKPSGLYVSPQDSAKTKADAEKAFEETVKLDKEVTGMMDQLSAAEKELAKKKAEADNDMMMANMVRQIITQCLCFLSDSV